MIEIRAIIRPSRLDKLRNALCELPDFPGMTIFKVQGFTAPSLVSKRTDAEELTDFTPKLMLSILVQNAGADAIQQIIQDQCRTGFIGDGLVWSVDVDSVIRIKDGSELNFTPSLSP
jgi:nitrogen regulatory protein P-II 1